MRRKKPKGNDRQYYSKGNEKGKKTYPGTKKKKKKYKIPYPAQKYYDRFAHPQKILQKGPRDGVWRFR